MLEREFLKMIKVFSCSDTKIIKSKNKYSLMIKTNHIANKK